MLLGIPLTAWGVVCLVIAIVYFFVWPKQAGDGSRPAWAGLALRYLHSLVWLLLAATCFLWAAGGLALARPFALLAAVCYAVFLFAFLKYGPRRRQPSRD